MTVKELIEKLQEIEKQNHEYSTVYAATKKLQGIKTLYEIEDIEVHNQRGYVYLLGGY